MYIKKIKNNSVGRKITTAELKEKGKSILSPKTNDQIDGLGVQTRYHANLGREDIVEHCNQIIKEILNSSNITNLVVASEISDYQTPGLAPLLVNAVGNNFVNVFNLQGTACSSMPKTLKLCEDLKGETLVVISGLTSPMYQKTLEDLIQKNTTVTSGSNDWVALMFAYLFGDGISSFITSNTNSSSNDYGFKHLGQITNMHQDDHRAAYVDHNLYPHANKNILNLPLQYTDTLMKKLKIEKLSDYDKIILHTGSHKIIESFKERYNLEENQIESSRYVLENFGNLTGCSLPFVLQHTKKFKKALMIGISMGASLDMVEVYH